MGLLDKIIKEGKELVDNVVTDVITDERKEKALDFFNDVKEGIKDVADDVKENAGGFADDIKNTANELTDGVKERLDKIKSDLDK